jgi:predicted enzyme related to lactoylglutathione lyase
MRAGIQSLSWWVRRLPDCDPAGFCFRDHLGLPMLGQRGRGWDGPLGSLFIFSGGGFFEFELMPGGRSHDEYIRPEQQDEIPIFRTFDLDLALAAVHAAGCRVLHGGEDDATVFFADPSGALNGLRAASLDSSEHCDVVARERHAVGGDVLAGYKPMPATVFDLGWVRMHVADVASQVAFYRDVVGLDVLRDDGDAGATLWLGDIARLEIRPGGAVQPLAEDRASVPEMWMLRVRDMDGVVQALKDADVTFVNEPWWLTGGELAYFVDPENHLVGIQDHPDDGRPQEQLAWSRWVETQNIQASAGTRAGSG